MEKVDRNYSQFTLRKKCWTLVAALAGAAEFVVGFVGEFVTVVLASMASSR